MSWKTAGLQSETFPKLTRTVRKAVRVVANITCVFRKLCNALAAKTVNERNPKIYPDHGHFGTRNDLLLLDNNIFTSSSFNASIDEIKELGFGKGEFYTAPNEYNIAVAGIRGGYNARACIKRVVKMYDSVITKLTETGQREFYIAHNGGCLLYTDTANAGAVLAFDEKFAPLYEKYFYAKINNPAASSGVCCFGKVFASGFNTADLWSDLIAPRGGVLNPSHTIKSGADEFVTSTVRRGKSFCEAAFGKT